MKWVIGIYYIGLLGGFNDYIRGRMEDRNLVFSKFYDGLFFFLGYLF